MFGKFYLTVFLLFVNSKTLFSQFLLTSSDDPTIKALSILPDSSLKKIVTAVYLKLDLKMTAPKQVTLDITNQFNRIIKVPDSIHFKSIIRASYQIKLQGYLYDFIAEDDTAILKEFSINTEEMEVINLLRQSGVHLWKYTHKKSESASADGNNKLTSSSSQMVSVTCTVNTPNYAQIPCTIKYVPSEADIYIVPKIEWRTKYKLSEPPAPTELTESVLNALLSKKVNRDNNPFSIGLNERSYVILLSNTNKLLGFEYLEPSRKDSTRNQITVKPSKR
ncbi:hypothetical protein [Chitinophaga filiformis]|uniref:Uncharacterized protein n=1 Tax=Chitinophaga filiformis TaxID=104663 RepID=A0ABY4I0B2_CHIFI|nr:hypothetical protein [Chitinophaga filiformis]UPK68729.1 hypothetical protein MYF79_27590 [Chitinophaga filiformis]